LGGQSVPAASPILKAFKTAIQAAKEKKWLEETKIGIPTQNKAGKTTLKKTPVLNITEAGEQFVRQAAAPEVLAATASAQLAALRQSLEEDRRKLREDVIGALAPKGKASGEAGLAKELGEVAKAVAGLAARLQKLEDKVQAGVDEKVLARIDEAFGALTAKLGHALPRPSPVPPPARAGETTTTTPPGPWLEPGPVASLSTVLHNAYEKLCCFREFQDGLVDMPRLYHEARNTIANLSLGAFHQELETLWNNRTIQLHVLNEVRSATEPDKGIRRNDKLYYYVYWPNP
jgi:hypothetical protein